MTKTIQPVVIGPCTLWPGDAMSIMPEMAADGFQARCVISDVPYELESGGCTQGGLHERFGKGTHGYGNSGNLFKHPIPAWIDFMPLIYGCAGPQSHTYIMTNNRNVQHMLNSAEQAGYGFHNLLPWDKRTATPNRWYMKNCEFTGFFYKGRAYPINDCSSKQLISCPQVDESYKWSDDGKQQHACEKPVALMEHYMLNSTQPDEIVFDPFMGVGTTGCAAVRSGRRFVGIEIDDEFFKIACKESSTM